MIISQQQMIHPPSQRLDDTLHLELEEDGREAADGNRGFDTEDIQLQVVGVLKYADD